MSFDAILSLPLGWAYLALFVIVMMRANATYWVGRLLVAGGRRSARIERFLDGPAMVRARGFTARWGVLAVPMSFLTIGIQTAVNLSAGALRMPLRRYVPAVTLGCLLWAAVYATIGLAAVEVIVLGFMGSPWALVGLAGLVLVALGVRWVQRSGLRRGEG